MNNDGPNMGDSDDDSDDGGDGDGFAFPDETIDESGFIAQPETCDKVKINYAKAAKKVDVQLLKESIWSRIERVRCRPILPHTSRLVLLLLQPYVVLHSRGLLGSPFPGMHAPP